MHVGLVMTTALTLAPLLVATRTDAAPYPTAPTVVTELTHDLSPPLGELAREAGSPTAPLAAAFRAGIGRGDLLGPIQNFEGLSNDDNGSSPSVWGKEIRFRRARRAGYRGRAGSDCRSCRRVCCTGWCVASFVCLPAAAVSGSLRSSSCATSWRSSGVEESGRSTRRPTEPCSRRRAACSRPSGGPALWSARRRFAAGTGHCCREGADAAVAGPAVHRLRPRPAA
jgi:hypothetical protein